MPDAPAPAVTVVIPAYNRAGSIRAAIESVLRQSWTDYELLVVDDGSTDGTLAAAAEVEDPRLRLIASPRNGGAAAARNLGVAESRGAWIAFQDSDDEWLPTKLAKQMARLTAPGAGFVGAYCGLLTLGGLDDRAGERLRLRYVPDPSIVPAEGDILTPLLFANMVSTQTLVVRRDVILELGRFDEDTTPIEDWDFVIRLSRRGPIAFVDEPLVHQRFSPNSITRDTAAKRAGRIRLVERNRAAFARHPALLARQYRHIANSCFWEGHDPAAAHAWLARALRAAPASPRNLRLALRMGLRWYGRAGLALRRERRAAPPAGHRNRRSSAAVPSRAGPSAPSRAAPSRG
jgi:glycosyltransferase involved in cell wall biosynthesis